MSSEFRQGMVAGALLVALLLAAFVGFCKAQDWLVVNGLVHHLSGHGYCNSVVTKGLGYERVNGSVRFAAGFYDNSNCQWSTYAAAAWVPLYISALNLRIGGIAGAVTGYKSTVTPAGGLAVASEHGRYGVNVIAIPPIGDSSPGVLWMQFKLRWR